MSQRGTLFTNQGVIKLGICLTNPKEKADKLEAEMETKRAEGRKLVEQLSSRYASWYYVVSGDSFRTVAADRSAFLQEPGETSPSAAPAFNPAGLPGF